LDTQISNDFSQDPRVLRVVMYNKPKLCDLYDLKTKYCLSDLLDFLELIDTTEALQEQDVQRQKAEQASRKNNK